MESMFENLHTWGYLILFLYSLGREFVALAAADMSPVQLSAVASIQRRARSASASAIKRNSKSIFTMKKIVASLICR